MGEQVLSGKVRHLHKSENKYDWLGHGIYFWENNPERALQFVHETKDKPRTGRAQIESPFVLGAIIDPGKCLNLLESKSLQLVREAYGILCESTEKAGTRLPKNRKGDGSQELLLRNLDCAVIEILHASSEISYDTVRGVFQEGPELYPGCGFREKNHIQLCVRNTECIRGYFRLLLETG